MYVASLKTLIKNLKSHSKQALECCFEIFDALVGHGSPNNTTLRIPRTIRTKALLIETRLKLRRFYVGDIELDKFFKKPLNHLTDGREESIEKS